MREFGIAEISLWLMTKVSPPLKTAGCTTERSGSSELKDELEVIEKKNWEIGNK